MNTTVLTATFALVWAAAHTDHDTLASSISGLSEAEAASTRESAFGLAAPGGTIHFDTSLTLSPRVPCGCTAEPDNGGHNFDTSFAWDSGRRRCWREQTRSNVFFTKLTLEDDGCDLTDDARHNLWAAAPADRTQACRQLVLRALQGDCPICEMLAGVNPYDYFKVALPDAKVLHRVGPLTEAQNTASRSSVRSAAETPAKRQESPESRIRAYKRLHLAIEKGRLRAVWPRYQLALRMTQDEIRIAQQRTEAALLKSGRAVRSRPGSVIPDELLAQAQMGDPEAQYQVALNYANQGPADKVEAYKWFHLAVENGKLQALWPRYELATSMTQEEIIEAQRRADMLLLVSFGRLNWLAPGMLAGEPGSTSSK